MEGSKCYRSADNNIKLKQNISKYNCSNKYVEYDYILHIKLICEHIFHVFVTAIVFRNVSTNIFYSDSERLVFTFICIVLHIKLEIRNIKMY